jgi:hypothetical protein
MRPVARLRQARTMSDRLISVASCPCRVMQIGLAIPILLWLLASGARAEDQWVYLDNGEVRLGVNRTAGACIGWLSAGEGKPNVLNSYDRGRFVQQSYYGAPDGSLWNGKPWRYNPIQGGDWQGKPATVLEFRAEPSRLYARTQAVHWASGEDLPEAIMEQWIELAGPLVHLKYRFSYTGAKSHPAHDHEIPAVFVMKEYGTLVSYEGDKPWRGDVLSRRQPGFPNEYGRLSEHWAAWVNEENWGLGVYVPGADRATFYRFGTDAGGKDACSYVAPLKTFAIEPGLEWSYEAWLALGTVDQLRERFDILHKGIVSGR